MTKLERYCNGMIEAACLAAVTVTPLFVNPLTSNALQPDKIAIFNGLALLIVCAWGVVAIDRWRAPPDCCLRPKPEFWRRPLVAPLAGLALVYVLATVFSLDPATSFWGGSATMQGTHTLLCGLVLAAAAARLQNPESRDRLLTAAIVAGLPVTLYGLLQHFGRNPFGFDPSPSASALRITSTLGNPIYLGAYLTMLLPLSAWRLMSTLPALRKTGRPDLLRWAETMLYALITGLEIAALYFTHSRGPGVALLVSLLFTLTFLTAHRHRPRRLIVALVAGGAVAFAILAARHASAFARASEAVSTPRPIFSVVTAEESSGRTDLWRAAADLLLAREPLPFPHGGQDPLDSLRFWLGYGPETLSSVLPHSFIPADVQPIPGTRFHNFIWDTWAATGAAGVAASLFVFLLIFFHGYRRLGWLQGRSDRRRFWILSVVGAAAGSAGLAQWQGAGFLGLGLQGGVIAALVVFPLLPASSRIAPTRPGRNPSTRILLMMLLVALGGHFMEMGFAFETAATCALAWVYLGLLLRLTCEETSFADRSSSPKPAEEVMRATPAFQPASPALPEPPGLPPDSASGPTAMAAAFVAALLTISSLYLFIVIYPAVALTPAEVLRRTLLQRGRWLGPANATLLILAATWIVTAFLLTIPAHPGKSAGRRLAVSSGVSGILALMYALFKAHHLSALGAMAGPTASGADVLESAHSYEAVYLASMGIFLFLILVTGYFLSRQSAPPVRRTTPLGIAAGIVCLGLYPAVALGADFTAIRADICLRWALLVNSSGVRPATIPLFQRALDLAPRSVPGRALMAQALADLAASEKTASAALAWRQRAEGVLLEGQVRAPLTQVDYQLGLLYLDWALHSPATDEQRERALQARRSFEHAMIFEARTEIVWNAAADVDRLFFERSEGEKKSARAFAFAPRSLWSGFGAYYAGRSLAATDPRLKEIHAERARFYLGQALQDPSTDASRRFDCLMWLAQLQRDAGAWALALESYEAAVQLPPLPRRWEAESGAAEACVALARKAAALDHLKAAIAAAPASRRPELMRTAQQVRDAP